MKINKKLFISSACLVVLFAFTITPVFATTTVGADFGFNDMTSAGVKLGTRDLKGSVMGIINLLMGFLGIIAIIIILVGGFKYMTAMGSDDKIGEAKKLIIAGIVGLCIILGSYSIAYFVVESMITATTTPTTTTGG